MPLTRPLLWSLADLEPIPSNIIKALKPRSILEIGTGDYSRTLLVQAMSLGARLTSIDTKPAFTHDGTIVGRSIDTIEKHGDGLGYDVAIIDGDHNYYTVKRELELLYARNPHTVFIMHDTWWPWGRRDMYYDPQAIPPEHRHPCSWELGVTAGQSDLVPWGFRGAGAFAVATHEGGPRNGVFTAIEDFTEENPPPAYKMWTSIGVTAVFGLSIVAALDGTMLNRLNEAIRPFLALNELLARLEKNRVELYLELLRRDYSR